MEAGLAKLWSQLFEACKDESIYCYYYNGKYCIFDKKLGKNSEFSTMDNFLIGLIAAIQNKSKVADFFKKEYGVTWNGEEITLFIKNSLALVYNFGIVLSKANMCSCIATAIYKADRVVKRPLEDTIIHEGQSNLINLYRVSTTISNARELLKKKNIITPTDFPHIYKFLEFFCEKRDSSKEYDYLINLLSWWLNNLGTKVPQISLIFTGSQGTGKNMFVEKILAEMLDENDFRVVDKTEIQHFNSAIKDKYLVYFDEIHADAQLRSVLKSIISNQKVKIEGKGKDSEMIENYPLYIFAKNNMHTGNILDDKDNRRYSIIFNGQSLEERWGRDEVLWWNLDFYKSPEYYKELTHFCAYLLSYPYDSRMASTPLVNAIRETMEEVAKEEDSQLQGIVNCLYSYLDDAVKANSGSMPAHRYKDCRIFYEEKDQTFYFNLILLRRYLGDDLSIEKKSIINALMLEKFNMKYCNQEAPHLKTYRGVTSKFLYLCEGTNKAIYNQLKGKYYELLSVSRE